MWLVILIGILALGITLLGSFVLLRSAKSEINFSFALLAYIIAIWMLANFLGANFKLEQWSLYATRVDFASGCLLVFSVWYFAAALLQQADERIKPIYSKLYGKHAATIVLGTAAVAVLASLLPQVLHITKLPQQELSVEYGTGFIVYAGLLVAILIATVVNLFLARKLARGRLRLQIGVMLGGLAVGVAFLSFANLILPQLSTSQDINLVGGNLSYVGVAFLIFTVFYAIVKHRLFDVRIVVARSVAYLLLIAALTAAYGVTTLLISNTVLPDYEITGRQAIVPVLAIVLLAFTVVPLSRYFNSFTNRIFYKDSYEPQQFLGDLNKVVIANVDIDSLLLGATQVIEKYLKAAFVLFDLQSSTRKHRATQGNAQHIDDRHIYRLIKMLNAPNRHVLILDELAPDDDQTRKLLENLNIALAIRLSTPRDQGLGYLLIGRKKNGASYNTQDLEMINIASGELVIAIQNAMRFEEIEQFNATLQEKIDVATKKLRNTNEKLRLLDQTKDDFISMASHQLRTPLTAVKGYVSMVLDGDAGTIQPQQRKMLTQAFISAQRMVYLISDLLNVSRLRTGKFLIEPIASNLAKVVQDEVDQLRETAAARNLQLSYARPERFPLFLLDETKLRQVIMNFIDNAIYYTPSGGQITVNLIEKPLTIEFTVVDNGIGVPRHEQPHLFTKFFRAHNAKRARPDGTGLGLFMAKKVIAAQGGSIIFRSQEDKGSTFGFSFAKEKLLPTSATSVSAAEQPNNKDV